MAGTVLLTETKDLWRISLVEDRSHVIVINRPISPDELAAKVREFIDDSNAKLDEVFIAVRSDRAMVASFSLNSNRVNDREMLLFCLEEDLPVVAEEMVADFVLLEDQAFGVAVVTNEYRPIVTALDTVGVRTCGIAPASTLIAQELCESLSADINFLQFDGIDGLQLFELEAAKPVSWWFQEVGSDANDLPFADELRSATLSYPGQIKLAVGSTANIALRGGAEQFELVPLEIGSSAVVLSSAVTSVVAGSSVPWIDLRRDKLLSGDPLREIRWPLRAMATSVLFLIMTLGFGLFLRAHRYESQMQSLHEQQRQMFADALPRQSVPAGGIVSRLKSHVKTMKGAREKSQDVELSQSAVLVLQRFLMAMSENRDFEVRQASIENNSIDVDMSVGSFADVNDVIGSLQNRGFEMSPPSSTQEDDETVVTRLVGEFKSAETTNSDTITKEVSR